MTDIFLGTDLTLEHLALLLRGVHGGTGIPKALQQTLIESASVTGQTLYLGFFLGAAAGDELDDTGQMITGMSEVSASGYALLSIASTDWDTTVLGALGTATSRSMPKSASSPKGMTAAADWGFVTAWALTTTRTPPFVNGTDKSKVVLSGPITDSGGTPIRQQVLSGGTLQFTNTSPIVCRFGDPAPGTVPL